jgi:hypothetical protein
LFLATLPDKTTKGTWPETMKKTPKFFLDILPKKWSTESSSEIVIDLNLCMHGLLEKYSQ